MLKFVITLILILNLSIKNNQKLIGLFVRLNRKLIIIILDIILNILAYYNIYINHKNMETISQE